MEQVVLVVNTLKGFANSSEEFVKGLLHRPENSARRNPIEILKRLQREAFSDIMKLRDRQDKVERMLSLYKFAKGSPFNEASTHVRGEVDVLGALLFVDNIDQQSCDTLRRVGIRTGIDSRFTFETTVRHKDVLVAEFVAGHNDRGHFGDVSGSPLSLTKVMYTANFNDWFSTVAIPWGARCKDMAIASNTLQQERSLTNFSSFAPPILGQCPGTAAGVVVKKPNIAASLAEFISEVGMQPDSVGIRHCFSTFGQVIYQISKGTKLTLLGLHKKLNAPSQQNTLGKFAIPVGSLKRHKVTNGTPDTTSPMTRSAEYNVTIGSIGLMLESELDESTRVGGWVEIQNSSPRRLQWSVSVSDTPEDELGWGLRLGGVTQVRPSTWDQFQFEAFLKLSMGNRLSLQPGLMYVLDGTTQIPVLMFRSTWSL